jgi:hypothetical protein
MSDDFWVDPDGLRRSAEGFTDKQEEISSISVRITALTDPKRVTAATGGDSGGREFYSVHLDMAGQLHDGVRAWSSATGATGGGLRQTARAFTTVEDNATTAAKSFHRNLSTTPPAAPAEPLQPATYGLEPQTPAMPADGEPLRPATYRLEPRTPGVPPAAGT